MNPTYIYKNTACRYSYSPELSIYPTHLPTYLKELPSFYSEDIFRLLQVKNGLCCILVIESYIFAGLK
jgi:hypothetical protein